MRIANVMISRVLGGVEQAFLDYTDALKEYDHELLTVTAKKGLINACLPQATNIKSAQFNFGLKGVFAAFPLFIELCRFKPDVVITHSKKIIPLLYLLCKLLKIKLVAVAHNDKYRHLHLADAVFSITRYQKEIFIKKGTAKEDIYVINNMIKEIPAPCALKKPIVPTYGVIGRFDPAKGFADFIEALHLLKQKKYPFKAVIGGKAIERYIAEEERLKKLVKAYGLENEVTFLGWIKNKDDFYNNIDVFVLPSRYEPFGIVLLEAMARSRPIISSTANGPKEIYADHPDCALTYGAGNIEELADKLIKLGDNFEQAESLAANGYQYCINTFSLNSVGKVLEQALKSVCIKNKP